MEKADYFRIMTVLSGNNAETFNTNVAKIVEAVLFYNNNQKITIDCIVEKSREVFKLNFSEHEIKEAIYKKGTHFIIEENHDDPVYTLYSLTPECYEKIQFSFQQYNNLDIFVEFLSNYDEFDISAEECKNVVMKYLYYVFCKDVKTIRNLFSGKIEKIIINEDEFTDAEKILINAFLNWNNDEKNQFVYNAIACGFDYCMLGLKKDNKLLRNVFSGKVFYLDANIIFRLMGLNKVERQNSIRAFIKKCLDANISVKYTNVTLGEINSVIEYRVSQIKKLFQGKQPISIEAIKALDPRYSNLDFINEYTMWANNPENKAGDYDNFIKHLKWMANSVLRELKIENFSSFSTGVTKSEFSALTAGLYDYKIHNHKETRKDTVAIDIENYMFVSGKYSSSSRTSVANTNYYIITADHLFINWASEHISNVIPIVMLPSVWYSILLKFSGRTDDDYKAFSSFLNFRLSSNLDEQGKIDEIIRMVVNLNESVEIKDRIVFEISSNIVEYRRQNISDVDIVQQASESVLKKEIDKRLFEYEEKWKEKYDNALIEGKMEYRRLSQCKDTKLIQLIKKEAPDKIKNKYYFRKTVFIIIKAIPFLLSLAALYVTCNIFDDIKIKIISFFFPNAFYLYDKVTASRLIGRFEKWSSKENLIREYIKERCEYFQLELPMESEDNCIIESGETRSVEGL